MAHWTRRWKLPRTAVALAAGLLVSVTLSACSSSSSSPTTGKVLLVGTFDGHAGQYPTIQAAVDAAQPGDWILIGPGDYHETADMTGTISSTRADEGGFGGVYVTKANLHIRGMNRSTVVVDGTKAGSAGPCSSAPSAQNFGALGPDGKALGRNGIDVFKASGVTVENLTACNFLAGSGESGNEVWWDGGADTAEIGLTGYWGSYLTATSTYFGDETTAAQYGIFASNSAGPASWDQLYGSNMNDSGMYVGACKQVCDVTIDHAWMEYDALGYSGTNSGGAIEIENSQFDNNEDGLDTNTQIGSDPPAPQNGDCPDNGISVVTGTHSCWVFIHNNVHDNNNPDVPAAGGAAAGPVGTGMTVSGGRNDTVMDNTFSNNGAWGILFVPYPDSDMPTHGQTCSGTGGVEMTGFGCVYDPEGDALLTNHFVNDGYFHNPSNGDFGQIVLNGGQPRNCFSGNVAPNGSTPANLEQTQPTCDGTKLPAADTGGALLGQTLCDTGFGSCPPGATYPKPGAVVLHPFPTGLPTMPNPCVDVPSNAWCANGAPV